MRDTLALALVRAELCRVHALGQRRAPAAGKRGAATVIRPTIAASSSIPFARDRGARHPPIGASDSTSPPD